MEENDALEIPGENGPQEEKKPDSKMNRRLSVQTFGRRNSPINSNTTVGNAMFPTPPVQENLQRSNSTRKRRTMSKSMTQATLEDMFNKYDAIEDGAVGRTTDIEEVWFVSTKSVGKNYWKGS